MTMALDSTACIKLQDVIHVLRYERLEQNYPIENFIQILTLFGIPALDTSCKCDCGAGTEVCTVEKFGDDRNCSSTEEYPTCFTKYHSDVANTECSITSLPAKVSEDEIHWQAVNHS
ncbi:unnamed protein product [Caenorhabditis auriculariae]|uniref:Uncharacterized protein n=1 Tax=Caenorhabditis auriculariae TaxID=2777116 RepID=A0A8S1HJ20_9PELO|nr:unnamed protein product [Caenorhabditis auriculariae]